MMQAFHESYCQKHKIWWAKTPGCTWEKVKTNHRAPRIPDGDTAIYLQKILNRGVN